MDTFSRYVPSSVVAELVGDDMHIELGGQQREITVLFCDIRGFTSWSEHREAVEIITELNALLSELSAAVIEHEGTLDKFTGDGLMAFWGAPLPTDDHAARACAAALEMLARLEALLRLLESADALIEGFRPGVAERLGVGPDAALARNPRLVYGRMTGWGQSGPLASTAGHDITYLALTGLLHGIGRAGEPPVPPGNYVVDGGGNMYEIARLLFTRYVFAFEATSALLITAALGVMVLAHRERHEPKRTQRELMQDRFKSGLHPTPLPGPGVYARHNAVDTPALLPDGSPSELSVPTAVALISEEHGRNPQPSALGSAATSHPSSGKGQA